MLSTPDLWRLPLSGDAEPGAAAWALPQLLAPRRACLGSVRGGRQADPLLLGKELWVPCIKYIWSPLHPPFIMSAFGPTPFPPLVRMSFMDCPHINFWGYDVISMI